MQQEADVRQSPCPFLVPVMVDWLWVDPTEAYCRRPDGRIGVRSARTIERLCSSDAHVTCSEYQTWILAWADRGPGAHGRD